MQVVRPTVRSSVRQELSWMDLHFHAVLLSNAVQSAASSRVQVPEGDACCACCHCRYVSGRPLLPHVNDLRHRANAPVAGT